MNKKSIFIRSIKHKGTEYMSHPDFIDFLERIKTRSDIDDYSAKQIVNALLNVLNQPLEPSMDN